MTVDDLSVFPSTVRHLRCDNPGAMTLTGTNTYVVDLTDGRRSTPGEVEVVVIDPGPALVGELRAHLEAIVAAVGGVRAGETRVAVLLTHHHDDHTGGVDDVVRALRAVGHEVSVHGAGRGAFPDVLGGLRVLETAGHTADSVCFLLGEEVLFTGDTVLGGSSSFIAHPDGDLTDYLASLDRLLAALPGQERVALAPGHGVVGLEARQALEDYRAHRRERLAQVRRVLDEIGPEANVEDVVAVVYADAAPELRPAVEAVVRAQVKHLRG